MSNEKSSTYSTHKECKDDLINRGVRDLDIGIEFPYECYYVIRGSEQKYYHLSDGYKVDREMIIRGIALEEGLNIDDVIFDTYELALLSVRVTRYMNSGKIDEFAFEYM